MLKMLSTPVTAIAVALCFVFIAESVTVPEVVIANTDVYLDLSYEVDHALLEKFDTYAVYLLTTPGSTDQTGDDYDKAEDGSCYLVQSSPLNITGHTIQIPASVGPSGVKSYWINTSLFNSSDVTVDKATGYRHIRQSATSAEFSLGGTRAGPAFSLQGGTGMWINDELHGTGMIDLVQQANVPCSAYECARQCTATHYQSPLIDDPAFQGGKWPALVEDTYRCIQKCPGVTYLSIEDFAKERGNLSHVGADGLVHDDVITSTVLGPLSTTGTKTILSTSVSFQSLYPTGNAAPTPFSNGTSVSNFASPTATPTIAATPPPKNSGGRSELTSVVPVLGIGFALLVLFGL